MASPPISIGPFSNCPAPGSPIRSDWPQEASQIITNLIAYPEAIRVNGAHIGPTNDNNPWNVVTFAVTKRGLCSVDAGVGVTVTGGTDATIDVKLFLGSTPYRAQRMFLLNNTSFGFNISDVFDAAPGQTIYVQVRKVSGPAFYEVATTDPSFNSATFVQGQPSAAGWGGAS